MEHVILYHYTYERDFAKDTYTIHKEEVHASKCVNTTGYNLLSDGKGIDVVLGVIDLTTPNYSAYYLEPSEIQYLKELENIIEGALILKQKSYDKTKEELNLIKKELKNALVIKSQEDVDCCTVEDIKEAIKAIDEIMNVGIFYDDSLAYMLTTADYDWLSTAKNCLLHLAKERGIN